MTTQYTSILKLALPVQGELSGTWGDVVNDNITSMVEEAVAGRAVINTWTTNSHVLTTADGTTSEARCAMLEFTDTGAALTGAATVVCPSASKLYVCKNDSGQQVTIQTAAGTGVAIPDGQTMFVFCDGTNVEQCETNFNSLSYNGYTLNFGGAVTTAGAFTTSGAYALTLTTTGATNVTLPTTGTLATLDGTETLTNKTLTAPTISSPSLTGSISATDLTISGNTTIGDASADTLTVNSTITSNLIFTDDTYDIGATGATRPRNLFLSGNATIGGTVTLSGGIDVTGALGVDGDFDVNTDKFTVASATGNTAVAGTLGVTGATTATGGLNVDTISEITATGGVTIDSVLLKDGGATLTGDLTVDTDTLYVDSTNNNVGIGLTSPTSHNAGAATLQIDGGANAAELRLTNDTTGTASSNGFHIATVGNKAYIVQNEADDLYFYNDGGEMLRFNSSDQAIFGASADRQVLIGSTDNTNATDATLILQNNTQASTHGKLFIASGTTTPSQNLGLGFVGFGDSNKVPNAFIGVYADGATWTTGSDMPTRMSFHTTADGASSSTERMRINNAGYVGIGGAADPDQPLHLTAEPPVFRMTNPQGTVTLGVSMGKIEWETRDAGAPGVIGYIDVVDSNNFGTAFDMKFASGASGTANEAMRINSLSYVVMSTTGNTRGMSLGSTISRLTIEGTSATAGRPGAAAVQNSNDTSGPVYYLAKTRGTANNSNTIVQDGDYLGQLNWNGADGTQLVQAANISGRVDGTPGVNDMPTRISFSTTADGANSPTERMQIDSDGLLTAYYNILIDNNADSTLFLGKGKEGVDGVVKIKPVQTGGDSDQLGISFYTHPSSSGSSLAEEAGRFTAPGQFIVGGGYTYIQNWYGTTGINDRQINAYNQGGNAALAAVAASDTTVQSGQLNLGSMGSSSLTAFAALVDDEDVGLISFQGADGTYLQEAARIEVEVDGTPGAADMPGRLSFRTTADGGTVPTEHMRITQNGRIYAYTQITTASSPYAATDKFHAIYNSSSAATGTLMTANNGNTWLNADGGTQLWLNWYSINNSASKTDTVIGDGGGGPYIFQVDASARNVDINDALLNFQTSGDGILFAGNSRTSAFNDYERGSWTPTITQATTAPSVTYTIRTGSYTKIGNMVYAFWDCTASSVSGGSGQFQLTGLPFSSSSASTMAGYSVVQIRSSAIVAASIAGDTLKGYVAGTVLYFEYDNTGSAGYGTRTSSVGLNSSGRTTGYIIYATT